MGKHRRETDRTGKDKNVRHDRKMGMAGKDRQDRKGRKTVGIGKDKNGRNDKNVRKKLFGLARKPSAETVAAGLILEAGILFVTILCYRKLVFAIPLQILMLPGMKEYEKWAGERRKNRCMEGFAQLLRSLMMSMHAGLSLENACEAACRELGSYYAGMKHPMKEELMAIQRGIALNIPTENLLFQCAENTGLEDMYEFAAVVEIAKKTGGNMVDILRSTTDHLRVRMETTSAIRVDMSGILYEKNIMLMMPFGMLVYLNCMSRSYVSCLYDTVPGRIIMTGMLLAVGVCYRWTDHIVKIEV